MSEQLACGHPDIEALLVEGYVGIEGERLHDAAPIGEFGPEDFIHEVNGDVCVFDYGGGTKRVIGRFLAKTIDIDGAIAEGVAVFDVFDHSASLIGYYDLYGDFNFKDKVLEALDCADEYLASGLLIIDRVELKPEYRGYGYGLEAMKAIISRLRMGAGLVAIKVFPLQFEGNARDDEDVFRGRGLDKYRGSEATCKKRLREHYGRLGFKQIPRTPYMCLPLISPLPWFRD